MSCTPRHLAAATVCLAFASLGSAAQAQIARPAWSRTFLQHPITLARLDDVAQELKLTDEQKKVEDLATDMQEKRQAIFASSTPDEFDQTIEDLNELSAQMHRQLDETLDEAQRKRIQEIYMQVNGPAALQNPEVAKMFDLSEEQQKTLDSAISEARTRIFGAWQELQGLSQEEADKRREEMANDRDKSYLAILSDEQKSKLDKMKGAEFAVDLSKLPNPFPG